jgi:hypothetical protein
MTTINLKKRSEKMCRPEPRPDVEERRSEIVEEMENLIMDIILAAVERLNIQNRTLKQLDTKWTEDIAF